MLKAVAEYVVRLTDLVEAEGRLLRAVTVRLGVGFILVLGAVSLGIVAFTIAMIALRRALEPVMGDAGSLALVAALCFLGAGGLAWAAKKALD